MWAWCNTAKRCNFGNMWKVESFETDDGIFEIKMPPQICLSCTCLHKGTYYHIKTEEKRKREYKEAKEELFKKTRSHLENAFKKGLI